MLFVYALPRSNAQSYACAQIRTRSVALTVPAYIAADLLRRDCPDASMALKSLDYPPVAAVTVSYPMDAIKQDRLDEARKLPGQSPHLILTGPVSASQM